MSEVRTSRTCTELIGFILFDLQRFNMKMFGNSSDRTKERLSVRRSRSHNVRPWGDKLSRGSSRGFNERIQWIQEDSLEFNGRRSNSDLLSALSRLSLSSAQDVKLAEENAFMRKHIIKLREETREEEDMDNDHEDLNDKENKDLFEIMLAELEKKHEKKRNTSTPRAQIILPSPPPPPPSPDEELLLAESDGEHYFESGESIDEWESL